MNETFSKLLVAKHSPNNKCYVPDGQTLYVMPRLGVPLREHVAHYFIATNDRKTRSRYGWVKQVNPFSVADFIGVYLAGESLDENAKNHLETMFKSVAGLAEGTPVAATYSCRGVERRWMEFTVHRVFFYKSTA